MRQWIIIHLICTSARSIFYRFCNFGFNRDKQKVVKTHYSICTMQIHLSFPLKLHYIPLYNKNQLNDEENKKSRCL